MQDYKSNAGTAMFFNFPINISTWKMTETIIVHELTFETLPPPLGNFGGLFFQKPYILSCSDQLVCTYIAGAFALGQLKFGTSLILGVGVTFSKWGWYGHLQYSGILQICCAGQVINRDNYQIPFRSTVLLS